MGTMVPEDRRALRPLAKRHFCETVVQSSAIPNPTLRSRARVSRIQSTLQTVQGLLAKARYAQARQAVTIALQRDPGHPFLVHALAVTSYWLGQHEQALHLVSPLAKAHPDVSEVQCTLGTILAALGRQSEAVAALEKAVALNPKSAAALMELGSVLGQTPRKSEALGYCRRAMTLDPANPEAATRLLLALHAASRPDEEAAVARATLARHPNHVNAAVALAHVGNYLSEVSPQESSADHRAVGALLAKLAAPRPHQFTNTLDLAKRLRIGFLSKDLRTHSVAFFLEPLLAALDRTVVEVFLYSATRPEDQRTERFRQLADTWRPVFGIGGLPLAQAIRSDQIDILLELGGLTTGHLLSAFVHRTAPVQVTYLGYPNTTGLASMDCRLVDSHTDPEGSERFSTERLVRLDPCFLCFQPPAESPAPARAPRERRAVTFGSFNALQKVSAATVALWARLLTKVPGARLLLKASQLADADLRQELTTRFGAAGISADRLELLATTPTIDEHLALYSRIDVALDTFPYAGTTTTCEAIWMGVPVVTLAGPSHASRVGVSLLNAIGAPELIAQTEDEYIQIASDLAANDDRLDDLRQSLRARMASCPLCNAPGFARRFEGALRSIWSMHCDAAKASTGARPA